MYVTLVAPRPRQPMCVLMGGVGGNQCVLIGVGGPWQPMCVDGGGGGGGGSTAAEASISIESLMCLHKYLCNELKCFHKQWWFPF